MVVLWGMNPFGKYAKKRLVRLQSALQEFGHRSDPELIHQVRVEIKKLKALLNLMGYSRKKFKSHETYIPFRTIHRASARIWEPVVMQRLLKQYAITIPNVNSTQEIEKFRSKIPKFVKAVRKGKQSILPSAKKVVKDDYRKYLKKKNRQVCDLITSGIPLRQLHLIRKQVKEVYYLLGIFKKRKQINPLLARCDNLIGNWLDQKLVLAQLRKSNPKSRVIPLVQSQMKSGLKDIRTELKYFVSQNK